SANRNCTRSWSLSKVGGMLMWSCSGKRSGRAHPARNSRPDMVSVVSCDGKARGGRIMAADARLRLAEVEQQVCDIASEQLAIPRHQVSPDNRIIEDLRCDSLDLVELFMEVEQAFGVTLPDDPPNPVLKAVFTRQPFRLADLAELTYLVQG